VVTGAGSGIGHAIARAFLVDGWSVVGLDVDWENGRDVRSELGSLGDFVAIAGDVRDESALEAAADAATDGRSLRCWVNNAGVNGVSSVHEMKREQYERVRSIALDGVVWASAVAVRRMLADSGGSIVNISSQHAILGYEGWPAYAACKAGVAGLTRQMSSDYCHRGIRVNAIAPGLIDTPPNEIILHRDPELREKFVTALCPQGRVGTADDVAQAALFLASEERAGFITGQLLAVDGGLTTKGPEVRDIDSLLEALVAR